MQIRSILMSEGSDDLTCQSLCSDHFMKASPVHLLSQIHWVQSTDSAHTLASEAITTNHLNIFSSLQKDKQYNQKMQKDKKHNKRMQEDKQYNQKI